MKNFTFFAALICTLFINLELAGQGGPAEPTGFLPDTWAKENRVIPSSPGSASLGSYGNVQVNHYTGTPGIQIPLYTVAGKYLSDNVSLSYDPNGLKVAALPSWVGWGWTLQGGGAITRTVRGLPDVDHNYYDFETYYPQFANMNLNLFPNNGVTIEWAEFMAEVSCGNIEVQPDIYHFNIPGYSGSFIITQDKEVIQKEFQELDITPHFTCVSQQYGDDLCSFTIKDPFGKTYTFSASDSEWTFFQDYYDAEARGDCAGGYIADKVFYSSWYLSKVVSADGSESIDYEYGDIEEDYFEESVNHYADDSKSVTLDGGSSWCPTPGTVSYSFGSTTSGTTNPQINDRKYLSEIILKIGGEVAEKVVFDISSTGEDPLQPSTWQTSGIKLNSFEVFKRWIDPIGTSPTIGILFEYATGNPTGRLTLEKVTERGFEQAVNNWIDKPPYVFEYDGNVPGLNSNSIDHWGYYNGAGNGNSLIPNVETCCNVYGGDALRHANYHGSGVLKKITYPTGGYTAFRFEQHEILPDEIRNSGDLTIKVESEVGGFRIERIADYDETGARALERSFEYVSEEETSSGLLMYALDYSKVTTMEHYGYDGCSQFPPWSGECEDYACPSVTIFANSVASYAARTGGHVGYSRVVESIVGDGGKFSEGNGKTVYEFINAYPSQNEIWNIYNGTLKAKKTYNSDGAVVREEFHIDPQANQNGDHGLEDCSVASRCIDDYHPFTVVADLIQSNRLILCEFDNNGAPWSEWKHQQDDLTGCDDTGLFRTKYRKVDHTVEQKWKRNTYSRVVEHFYDVAAGTVEKVTSIEYEDDDIALPTAFSFENSDNKVHRTEVEYFHSGNIDAVPKKITKKVNGTVVGGTNQDLDNYGRPLVIYEILEGGTGLSRGVIGGYTHGRPRSYTYMSFPTIEFTWVNGLLTEKKQSTWEWSYSYDERRLMTRHTDIDGQESAFEYDGLLRLFNSSDRNGGRQQDIVYNYGLLNGGENYVETTISFTDFDDQVTRQTVDGLGRGVKTIKMGYGPLGEDITTEYVHYDDFGRVEKKVYLQDVEASVTYTEYSYDGSPLNRLVEEKYPDGNSIKIGFGATINHYLTESKDENGNPTTTKTDLIGRKVSTTDAMGGLTSFYYDDRNNLEKVVNPELQEYLYSFDLRNRMVTKKIPGAGCQNMFYDHRDQLLASNDANLRVENKWLVYEYDDFGRMTRYGFDNGGPSVAACAVPPTTPAFAIDEELVVNTYDTNNSIGDCSYGYEPVGKQSGVSVAIIDDLGNIGGMLSTRHCFDDFGRIAATQSSTLLGQDIHTFTMDMADNILSAEREHTGTAPLEIVETFDIDHGGRMVGRTHNISVPGVPSVGNHALGLYTYNAKDQLIYKEASEIALETYTYNERGWLTQINSPGPIILHDTTTCTVVPPDGGGDQCGECGDQELTLEQLLQVRFLYDMKVDCYIPCDCNAACDPEDPAPGPCPPETPEGGGSGFEGLSYEENIKYPTNLFRLKDCEGSEGILPQRALPQMPGNYAALGRYTVESATDTFRVLTAEGETFVDVPGLLAIADGSQGFEVLAGPGEGEGPCPPECTDDPPACDAGEYNLQQASLGSITPISSVSSFPTNLSRIRLCAHPVTGVFEELYLFDEELSLLYGSYMTLQTIFIENYNTTIVETGGQSPIHKNVFSYINSRTEFGSDPLNYYAPCGQNECGVVGEKTPAWSVGPTTKFSQYDGVSPYRDLVATTAGENYSLVHDFQTWDIEFNPLTEFAPGEVEWDMGLDVAPGANIKYYKVEVIIPSTGGANVRVGLHDGTGFIKINGGQDFASISGPPPFPQQPFLSLIPDVLPGSSQIESMKVVLWGAFSFSGRADTLLIDGVHAVVDYTEICEFCSQEPPSCSPEEEAAQLESLEQIQHQAATTPLSSIPLPTNLYRVQLCNGDEVYLLHHELDMLTGSYIILQVIKVNGLNQHFISDVGPQVTPNSGRPAPYFHLRLSYYGDDPEVTGGDRGYKNGNIAAMYSQVYQGHEMVYEFEYDNLDRLKNARFANLYKDNSGNKVYIKNEAYSVPSITYDAVGNIMELRRWGPRFDCEQYGGEMPHAFEQIDHLTYNYTLDKSHLADVTDPHGPKGFKYSTAYSYDPNGNMINDTGKEMDIRYNYLNLPRQVEKTGLVPTEAGTIKMFYDASGRKLSKTVDPVDPLVHAPNVIYGDGIEVTDGRNFAVYTAEGRVTWYVSPFEPGHPNYQEPEFQYEAMLKDHLGNTRATVSKKVYQGEPVIEEFHYYPFGMLMEGNWRTVQAPEDKENPYGYNAKEHMPELGFGLSDYGARYYDPSIGRFTGVDPLADSFDSFTVFGYSFNNPITFNDPTGMAPSTSLWGDNIGQEKREGNQARMGFTTFAESIKQAIQTLQNGDPIYQGSDLAMPVVTAKAPEKLAGTLVKFRGYYYSQSELFELARMDSGIENLLLGGKFGNDWASAYFVSGIHKATGEAAEIFATGVATVAPLDEAYWGGKLIFRLFRPSAAKGVTANPFKGKTFSQIDEMFKAKGFTTKGVDPLTGKGSYFSPSGTRYYLDKGGMYKKGFEGPHVDIWYNGHPSFEKVKFFLDGSPKMYTPLK